jgi:hypothetical protein
MAENDLGIEERLRRKMGRAARTESIATRFTGEEAAVRQGLTIREWAREVMLQAASSAQTDVPVFTEVVALRLLMTNVLRPLALGQTIKPEDFQAVLAGVRKDKHDAARDLLEQYQKT